MYFRGLLSEKSDDSLFFVDVGQSKKAEQKGKYVIFVFVNYLIEISWDLQL